VAPGVDADIDPEIEAAPIADSIGEMLSTRLPDAHGIEVRDVARVFGGNARQAWSATATWRDSLRDQTESLIRMVRRAGSQVQTDPRWELAVLDGLAEQGVRAPRVWGHDLDGHLLGDPAVLLQRLSGSADAVAYLRAEPEVGRARTLDLARAAAELHAVEPAIDALEPGEPQLEMWQRQFLAARLEPLPALGWVFDWLADHQLPPARPVLVHGDFRPGNVLYAEDRITGVLDWEMAHLGHPAEDLAWAYRALWSPQRFVPLKEFLATYTASGGADISVEALRWHRVFCEAKFATISLLAARSVVDGASHNLRLIDRAATVVPAVRRCLDWIGAPDRQEAAC
jgi:aminoglycoside phosphotransferase (APT) family kinase protein